MLLQMANYDEEIMINLDVLKFWFILFYQFTSLIIQVICIIYYNHKI